MQRYRLRLAALWFAAFLLLTALLAWRSSIGAFGDAVEGVWQWFLPNILPTMTLVCAVSAFALTPDAPVDEARITPIYRLAVAVSVAYLLLLTLPILMQAMRQGDPLPDLQRSNLWLGPLQGVAASVLGVFFTKR